MKARRLCAAIAAMTLATAGIAGGEGEGSTLTFGRFGTVHLYRGAGQPSAVVLFVSGDGGWNLGVVDMANDLAGLGALVIGVDITHYMGQLAMAKESCIYPAAEFEGLSQYVQKKLDLPRYTTPLLIGYSSGATLVYAVLVQAPPNTFGGAISLGFCPDLPLVKPMCHGRGLDWTTGPRGKGFSFLPARVLSEPWVAFQGTIDQVCDPKQTEQFVSQTANGEIVVLPKVGHGYSVPKNWLPQFRETYRRLVSRAAVSPVTTPIPAPAGQATSQGAGERVSDLPLVELPASQGNDILALVVSGDGGWAGIDREVGAALNGGGVAVIGLDSLRYFWTSRTPEQTAADAARIARHYLEMWHREKLLLLGYSRGADVLPFIANRLPEDLKARLVGVALLAPSRRVEFEFHLSDWLGGSGADGLPTEPEARRLTELRVPLLCFFGEDETDTLCRDLSKPFLAVSLPEGHHMGGRYDEIAKRILGAVASGSAASPGSAEPG